MKKIEQGIEESDYNEVILNLIILVFVNLNFEG